MKPYNIPVSEQLAKSLPKSSPGNTSYGVFQQLGRIADALERANELKEKELALWTRIQKK